MKQKLSKKFQIKSIRMLLKKDYKFDVDKIDFEAYVDSALTLGENLNFLKKKFFLLKVK
jgi:hypothetical protein